MRCAAEASSALKKTKRRTPLRSAARSSRTVASPFSSSILWGGWSRIVAARWIDGVDPAQRLAHQVGVGHLAEVAERDLHVDPPLAQPPRLAHQAAHLLALLQQQRQQARSDASGGPCQQQHRHIIPSRIPIFQAAYAGSAARL